MKAFERRIDKYWKKTWIDIQLQRGDSLQYHCHTQNQTWIWSKLQSCRRVGIKAITCFQNMSCDIILCCTFLILLQSNNQVGNVVSMKMVDSMKVPAMMYFCHIFLYGFNVIIEVYCFDSSLYRLDISCRCNFNDIQCSFDIQWYSFIIR